MTKPHDFQSDWRNIGMARKDTCSFRQGVKVGQTFFDIRNSRAESRQPLAFAKYQCRAFRLQCRSQASWRRQIWPLGWQLFGSRGQGRRHGGHQKMPSSEIHKVKETAWASDWCASNEENRLVNLGQSRSLALARHSPDCSPVQPWTGRPPAWRWRRSPRPRSAVAPSRHGAARQAKDRKTRTPKKYSNKFIVSRRKVGKRK